MKRAPGPPRRVFWAGLVVGWSLIAFGIRGVLVDAAATKPKSLAEWVVGAALVHDLLVAPLALGIGWLLARALPRRLAHPVMVGLSASVVLVAFTWALVRGYGRRASLPSALPLDYGRNLAVGLAAIWIVVVVFAVATTRRARRRENDPV